jgi:hypothetical protein
VQKRGRDRLTYKTIGDYPAAMEEEKVVTLSQERRVYGNIPDLKEDMVSKRGI